MISLVVQCVRAVGTLLRDCGPSVADAWRRRRRLRFALHPQEEGAGRAEQHEDEEPAPAQVGTSRSAAVLGVLCVHGVALGIDIGAVIVCATDWRASPLSEEWMRLCVHCDAEEGASCTY